MKPGYRQCPCDACQEVLAEGDGPRRPCLNGFRFRNDGTILERQVDAAPLARDAGR